MSLFCQSKFSFSARQYSVVKVLVRVYHACFWLSSGLDNYFTLKIKIIITFLSSCLKPLTGYSFGYIIVFMRGKENKELNNRIVELWKTGRYKSYSSLARVLHIKHPKIVERAVKKALQTIEARVTG